MDILETIINTKRIEVALKKIVLPSSQLQKSHLFERNTISLTQNLKKSTSGIIAEFKRRSPSKGTINDSFKVQEIVRMYETAGACGASVLTDMNYFGGSTDDLLLARASIELPILRKEFIIDQYQILEAKSIGADVILLIAAVLTEAEIIALSRFAKSLQLEVLIEIHNREELQKSIHSTIDMIGVNNRNLKNFDVNINISKELASQIPDSFLKISESGIQSSETAKELQSYGYNGFLIGENFMKSKNPEKSAKQFINDIES